MKEKKVRKGRAGCKGGGVLWYVPNRKRPIGETTLADSDFIHMLNDNNTPKELLEKMKQYICYSDAKDVMERYVELGYGDIIIDTH